MQTQACLKATATHVCRAVHPCAFGKLVSGQLSCSRGGEQGLYLLVTLAIILYKIHLYLLQLMGLHGDNTAVSVPQLCTPTRPCCCILHSGTEPRLLGQVYLPELAAVPGFRSLFLQGLKLGIAINCHLPKTLRRGKGAAQIPLLCHNTPCCRVRFTGKPEKPLLPLLEGHITVHTPS